MKETMEDPTTKPPLGERLFRTWLKAEIIAVAVIAAVALAVWIIF